MLGCTMLANTKYKRGSIADLRLAGDLHQKACDRKASMSCRSLGTAYLYGIGRPKKPVRGAALFRKACNDREWHSCQRLAELYERGAEGIQKNPLKANTFFEKACKGGLKTACDKVKSE